jgi:FAD/FMN-containing dehydrogenase
MPALRRVAGRVLEVGGKIDLLSIRPEGEFLSRQLGPELGRLRELKARVDPHGLLNPGLLTPEPDGR